MFFKYLKNKFVKNKSITYRTGYGTDRRTLEELLVWPKFAGIHPEIQKRLIALMDIVRNNNFANFDFGIGSGFRTEREQLSLFLSRHNEVASGGCCSYNGINYTKLYDMAHQDPPFYSYYEGTVSNDSKTLYSVAADLVGWHSSGIDFLTHMLAHVGLKPIDKKIPWGVMPIEFPEDRLLYDPQIHVLQNFLIKEFDVFSKVQKNY